MKNEKLLYLLSCIASGIQDLFTRKSFEPRSILVVKLDEIGDMVYALHVFEHLKKTYPNALLNVYCRKYNNSLVESTGHYDRIINQKEDLAARYDLLVNLRGDWFTFWLGFHCKKRLERGCIRIASKLKGGQVHEVYTNFRIIRPLLPHGTEMTWPRIGISANDHDHVSRLLRENGIERFALLHTGARDRSRRWPAERFARLADWLHDKYGLVVILGGGPGERNEVDQISAMCSHPVFNYAGKTSLTEFGALCEKAALFIGNESGPLHIANVTNTPIVALFGPGVRDVFYPYGDNVRILHHFRPRGHTRQTAENSTIRDITLEEVKSNVKDLLSTV